MGGTRPFSVADKIAVLATMHGGERATGAPIGACPGLPVRLPAAFDTDRRWTTIRVRSMARGTSPRRTDPHPDA